MRARLHFRVATEARRHGDDDIARRHFVRAGELAPMDFTIRRAAMPLMGGDPFGQDFMELYQEWKQRGEPVPRPPAHDRLTDGLSRRFRRRCRGGFGAHRGRRDAAAQEQRDEREHREDRERHAQRVDAGVGVLVDHRGRRRRGHAGVVERLLEVGVGDEGHAAGELGLRLRREVVRHRRVARDAGEERRGERRHEDRAGQRGPERDPEVGEGVLQAADLAALLVGQRGDGDRAELRRQRADAETGEEHRPERDLGPGALVERGDEHDQTEEQHEEPEAA